MIVIDANKLILGRLAAVVAKRALKGEEIIIVNSENAVITGRKKDLLNQYHAKRARGDPLYGPYFPRRPNLIIKRTIRGMLPYKQEKGLKALNRIKCYNGIPLELKDKKMEMLAEAKLKGGVVGYMSLKEISSLI
ncbi:MAG: 50S ribosomal protein L13 [Candidatus Nanoarchaeia archaeon]|nr:50S ribosomal protein L13 [Candidatus Nanoarchaeia archaeon]